MKLILQVIVYGLFLNGVFSNEDINGFECRQSGHFKHPNDCTKFIQCGAYSDLYIKSCGAGTMFNPSLQVCDWPSNVNCNNGPGDNNLSPSTPRVDVWSPKAPRVNIWSPTTPRVNIWSPTTPRVNIWYPTTPRTLSTGDNDDRVNQMILDLRNKFKLNTKARN